MMMVKKNNVLIIGPNDFPTDIGGDEEEDDGDEEEFNSICERTDYPSQIITVNNIKNRHGVT